MLAITDFMLPLIHHKIRNVPVNRNYGACGVMRLRCFASYLHRVSHGKCVHNGYEIAIGYCEKLEEMVDSEMVEARSSTSASSSL